MRKSVAAAGSAAFFALAPGVVAGLLPWWLTRWRPDAALAHWLPARLLGILILLSGTALLVHAFARFVVEGTGTPAPIAPPTHLVVGGLYRYVRNPMYLAVIATILGQALLLWRPVLLGYAALVTAAMVAFVLGHEQPALTRRFGNEIHDLPPCRPRLVAPPDSMASWSRRGVSLRTALARHEQLEAAQEAALRRWLGQLADLPRTAMFRTP